MNCSCNAVEEVLFEGGNYVFVKCTECRKMNKHRQQAIRGSVTRAGQEAMGVVVCSGEIG